MKIDKILIYGSIVGTATTSAVLIRRIAYYSCEVHICYSLRDYVFLVVVSFIKS